MADQTRNFPLCGRVTVGSLSSHVMQRTPRRSAAVLLVLMAACHPGNQEAKRLRESCDAGDAAACNQLAIRVQKGQYVLRDVQHAATLYDRACEGGVATGCASLGVMYLHASGVTRDSARS